SAAVRPVSLMMVGERMFNTCRSTNDSHEQSAMPTQGTHICQVTAVGCAGDVRTVASVIVSPSYVEGLATAIGKREHQWGCQEEEGGRDAQGQADADARQRRNHANRVRRDGAGH